MLKKLLSSSYVDQFLIELHGNLMYSLKLQIQTARFKSFFQPIPYKSLENQAETEWPSKDYLYSQPSPSMTFTGRRVQYEYK